MELTQVPEYQYKIPFIVYFLSNDTTLRLVEKSIIFLCTYWKRKMEKLAETSMKIVIAHEPVHEPQISWRPEGDDQAGRIVALKQLLVLIHLFPQGWYSFRSKMLYSRIVIYASFY